MLGGLPRTAPNDRLPTVVDLIGDPVALLEANSGQDAGQRLGDMIEGVVAVVANDYPPGAAFPEPGPALRGRSTVVVDIGSNYASDGPAKPRYSRSGDEKAEALIIG